MKEFHLIPIPLAKQNKHLSLPCTGGPNVTVLFTPAWSSALSHIMHGYDHQMNMRYVLGKAFCPYKK